MGGKKTKRSVNAYRYFTAFLVLILTTLIVVYGCSVLQEPEDGSSAGTTESGSDVTQSGTVSPSGDGSSSSSDISNIPLPPDEKKEDTVVSILACGDNLIHPSVYYNAMRCYSDAHNENCTYVATNDANYDFMPIYENVAERMKGADICYINQETLSGGDGTKIYGYPTFNSPEAVGRTLRDLGVDVINMAHNHMLDAGNDSFLIHSDGFFSSLGMTPLGYYKNEADTNNIVLYEEQGIIFAFLTYTYGTNGISCYSETYIPYMEEAFVRKQVALAKQQADVVIVSAHWGWEDTLSPNSDQRFFADLFCELGVDVVIGMHSHCIQPMKWVESSTGHRMLLTYSLGNFVSGMQSAINVLEGMLSFNVRKNAETGEITVEDPLFTPLVLHYTKENSVDTKLDTGYRNFKLYDLKDYTPELAAAHGVVWYEKSHGTTLHGGGFNVDNMYQTLRDIIPAEFLPPEYR